MWANKEHLTKELKPPKISFKQQVTTWHSVSYNGVTGQLTVLLQVLSARQWADPGLSRARTFRPFMYYICAMLNIELLTTLVRSSTAELDFNIVTLRPLLFV